MKIDKIIFAVDNNPDYQGFWEINSEICKKKLGITPVLFRITDNESDFYYDDFGLVKNIKSLPNVNTGFQAQIYRMYGTKYFQGEICMTSDIDMLLFNKDYIQSNVKDKPTDDLIIFNSDAYDNKRPECYGIYSGPDRYPICYVAAKGSTFDKVINNNVPFEDYCNRLLSLDLGWDTDEIYFGRCVNNQKEVTTHKIVRGYSSSFYCPNRIERPDFFKKGIFYLDLEKDINLDPFIDCHCARPYWAYESKIKNIKRIILEKPNEVYLIGCHIENEIQEKLLRELVNELEKNDKKFVLTSHTLLPQDIIKKSVGFIYDSINPTYKTWELEGYALFKFETDTFKLESPYISYGASDYYHVGVIRLFINALKYLQTTDFKNIHWIEYDSIPDFNLNDSANELLKENDFIFYGVGSRFSFNIDQVSDEFLKMKDFQILQELNYNQFLAEKLLSKKLIKGKKKTFVLDESLTDTWGRYSQNFNSTKINWSLFEHEGNINLFLHNISREEQNIKIEINKQVTDINLPSYNWNLKNLGPIENIKFFKIINNLKVLVDTDLSIGDNYRNIIEKVIFTQKS